MSYGPLVTGYNAKPLDVIEAEIKAGLRDPLTGVSETLNLGSRSLLGQFVGVLASQLRQLWEADQAAYISRDRRQALGDALDILGEYTGTPRDPATPSTALLNVTLNAGTYAIGTLSVYRTSDATIVFTNSVAVTTAGGTVNGVAFKCTQTGPVAAPSGTLVNIIGPTGFTAVAHPADATLGQDVETDADYRARQQAELQKGSASVDAIRAALLANDNITFAVVLENELDVTDGNGLPLRSVAPIVEGGTNAEVAQIIFERKSAGIRSHGSTTVTVTDQQGNPHSIRFTRPTLADYQSEVTYSYLRSAYISSTEANAAVGAALAEAFTANQKPGVDIINSTYVAAVRGVAGIVDCIVKFKPTGPGPYSTANVSIGAFVRATLNATVAYVPTDVAGIP